ncbi:hypothetical protein VKT23_013771 [Stygiomarasmius scandens]|uniref:Uncharacterized protein n=1 Tax=Marasmiellus scandens TaxID=2682957 RepID=A0ABR1J562_9AGAR
MLFGLLGDVIHGATDFAAGTIAVVHHVTAATIDHTPLNAIVPKVIHEISGGVLGLAERSIRDVGQTTDTILKSVDGKASFRDKSRSSGNQRHDSGSYNRRRVKLCPVSQYPYNRP